MNIPPPPPLSTTSIRAPHPKARPLPLNPSNPSSSSTNQAKAQQEVIKAIHHLFHLGRHASKPTTDITIGKSRAKTTWGVKEERLDLLTPVKQPKEKKYPKFLLDDVIMCAEEQHGSFLEVAPTSFRFMDSSSNCSNVSGGVIGGSGDVTVVGDGSGGGNDSNSNSSTLPVLGTIYGKEDSSNPSFSTNTTSPKKKNVLVRKTLLKRLTDEIDVAYYNHYLQSTLKTKLANTPAQILHKALSCSFTQTKTEIQACISTISMKEVDLQRLVSNKKKEILGLKMELVKTKDKAQVFEAFLRGLVPPQDAHQFSKDEGEEEEDEEEDKKISVDGFNGGGVEDEEGQDNASISSVQKLLANEEEEDDDDDEEEEQMHSLASPTKKTRMALSHDHFEHSTPPLPSTILMNSYLNDDPGQPQQHTIPGSVESEESIVAQQLLAVGNVSTLEDSDFIFD